jgi:hypothetical protein
VSRGRANRLWWVSSKRGLFKVKSSFSSFSCSKGWRFPLKCLLHTHANSKGAFFFFFFFFFSSVVGGLRQDPYS